MNPTYHNYIHLYCKAYINDRYLKIDLNLETSLEIAYSDHDLVFDLEGISLSLGLGLGLGLILEILFSKFSLEISLGQTLLYCIECLLKSFDNCCLAVVVPPFARHNMFLKG